MVASEAPVLDATFHALAHPTRRAMLRMLADGREHTVGELAAPFDVSLAACSKHLRVLETARLVSRRVVGRTHACRLEAAPLRLVADWTEEFRARWEASFARLDEVLEDMKSDPARATADDPEPG
jgi:DNA-binding transcriptional ArsR family regulator